VEIVIAQAIRGKCIDTRRFDQTAETANLREADIVEQEDDDVRRILLRLLIRCPPFLGVFITLGYDAAEPVNFLLLDAVDDDNSRSGPCLLSACRALLFAAAGRQEEEEGEWCKFFH
jgi:hypothetical protein